MTVEESIKQTLKNIYGYDGFRMHQEDAILSIINGQDTFTIMPTGGGKSICYQLPAMYMRGCTIVVSPLLSLMKDQVDQLERLGIAATCINSSLEIEEYKRRMRGILNHQYRIIYMAPERLENPKFSKWVHQKLNVSFIAIDEAHCVSQWGHDFRPSYRKIADFVNGFQNRPIMAAFTATATPEVKQDAVRLLGLHNPNVYVGGFDRENLMFKVYRDIDKRSFVTNYIKQHPEENGIIYCSTRKEVEALTQNLQQEDYLVSGYHGGMEHDERKKAQEDFIYDRVNIIVATCAFGMGIDKPDVRYVIHYNMPSNIESYYQEAGRAGRDGLPSECILLFRQKDIYTHRFLIEQSSEEEQHLKKRQQLLDIMVDYCYTNGCLRKFILDYFNDDSAKEECDNCGNCKSKIKKDITGQAIDIIQCVKELKGRFGVNVVANVLKGSSNERMMNGHFNRLTTYGSLASKSVKEIKTMIYSLLGDGCLKLTDGEYPVLNTTIKSVEVLKGRRLIYQRQAMPQSNKLVNNKLVAISPENKKLFEALKILRTTLAKKESVPAYVIFSDKTLKEMASNQPESRKDMLNITGVGHVKYERYGQQFLKVISDQIKENN